MNRSGDMSTSTDSKNAAIERALEPIREDLEKVDLEFRKNLQSDVSIISAIGEYVLSSGGKRFRPILLILSARVCGYQGDRHIPLASLVEFIHTATLLHDDVVDKAEIRRGSASANSKWGNEASVLVGDFLFTKSFSLLVEKGNWEIFQVLSRATTLMAEGELEELIRTDDISLTEEGYLSIIARKTASLISAASQVGAILADVPEEKKMALSRFGTDVGIAFQLMDDTLDYTSREEEFGKEIGIDLQRGKITLPLIYALRHCTLEEKTFIQETVEEASLTQEAFLRVSEIIERSHGIRYSCEKGKEYIDRAKRHLDLFEESEFRQALFTLADYVIERRL
jgi:octaprenyl-diphosphate synthase